MPKSGEGVIIIMADTYITMPRDFDHGTTGCRGLAGGLLCAMVDVEKVGPLHEMASLEPEPGVIAGLVEGGDHVDTGHALQLGNCEGAVDIRGWVHCEEEILQHRI